MTTVFQCDRCGVADDINATQTTSAGYLCSECLTGQWHGLFSREQYSFAQHGPALNRTDPPNADDGFPSFS